MNTPNQAIEVSPTVAERLQAIADRRNATGRYVVTYTPESILSKMEKECDAEEAQIAKSKAVRDAQQAKKDAELAALDLFKMNDEITFMELGKRIRGDVTGFITEGLLAPALEVWTGSLAQQVTRRPLCVKPIKDSVNGLRTYMDGDQWCCVDGTFNNLQESRAGFGTTEAEAVKAFIKSNQALGGA